MSSVIGGAVVTGIFTTVDPNNPAGLCRRRYRIIFLYGAPRDARYLRGSHADAAGPGRVRGGSGRVPGRSGRACIIHAPPHRLRYVRVRDCITQLRQMLKIRN